jgi:hypothetical protein
MTKKLLETYTIAELNAIHDDLFDVLQHAPNEVAGLLDAVRTGKIEGSCYEGDCSCLVGTIANLRGCYYAQIPGIIPDASRPIEIFFWAVDADDTPENNPFSKYIEGWILEWQANHMTPEVNTHVE